MSGQLRLSAKGKGDNEIKLGAVHKSTGVYLTAKKIAAGLIKAVWPVIDSNGVPYLQMMSIGSQRTLGNWKEGNDGTGHLVEVYVLSN